jgi:hypothetical protein
VPPGPRWWIVSGLGLAQLIGPLLSHTCERREEVGRGKGVLEGGQVCYSGERES